MAIYMLKKYVSHGSQCKSDNMAAA